MKREPCECAGCVANPQADEIWGFPPEDRHYYVMGAKIDATAPQKKKMKER